MKIIRAIVLTFSLLCVRCYSQFYAPDTEYHDPVQRVYAVEAARVLAWLENVHNPGIAEVTYSVVTKTDHGTTWEIRCLDREGKVLKRAKVEYARTSLESGPAFYRNVFEQLWKASILSKPIGMPDQNENTLGRYWKGAGKIGFGREESMATSLALSGANLKINEVGKIAPELAGLLTHAALPSLAGKTSLDNVMVARGAAWLALVEHASAAKFDSLWAPVLFLSNRDRAAGALWQKEVPAGSKGKSSAEQFWDLILRGGSTKEAYLFATEEKFLPFALPLLSHDVRVNGSSDLMADLLPQLIRSNEKIIQCHNYAPLMAMRTSVGGGHILQGAWAYYGRVAWMDLMKVMPEGAADRELIIEPLETAIEKIKEVRPEKHKGDASLFALKEVSPLLNLARKEGIGSLRPCGVVTVRDVLNYGWEMAGLQLGARGYFVLKRWGIPDLGEAIYKSATEEVEGWIPFFRNSNQAPIATYHESLVRLQMLEGLFHLVGFNKPPFGAGLAAPEAARLWLKRSWMRPADFEWQARTLWDAEIISEIPSLITTLQGAGPRGAVEVLGYFQQLQPQYLQMVPRGEELKYEMADMLPQPTRLYFSSVYSRDFAGLDPVSRGPEFEKIYWKHPEGNLEARVVRAYLGVHAFGNAKRFYTQMRRNITDPVSFSHSPGKMLWMLGYVTEDEDLRKKVLEDSESGSGSDMMINIWEAAARGNERQLTTQVNEMIDRYEQEEGSQSLGRTLKRFLPYLAALKDKEHPRREDALRYFGKFQGWTVLRWIWIEKYKLTASEAATFLGGKENDHLRRFLIACAEKDQGLALEELNAHNANKHAVDEVSVLTYHLYSKMHPPEPETLVDLMPKGLEFTREAVLKRLGS